MNGIEHELVKDLATDVERALEAVRRADYTGAIEVLLGGTYLERLEALEDVIRTGQLGPDGGAPEAPSLVSVEEATSWIACSVAHLAALDAARLLEEK